MAGKTQLLDGTVIQSSKSIQSPLIPHKDGKVRAELLAAGFVITPIHPSNGIASSLVTYVVRIDPKGKLLFHLGVDLSS